MLRVTGLEKRYGDRVALDGVDFEVGDGEIFGFVGPNGAGKSTTMRAVMGVLTPDAGELTWNSDPLDRTTRRRFGYMPEERGLYQKMTVLNQVEYFARIAGLEPPQARRNAECWVEQLQLTDHRDKQVQALSLGNQQRVQLAVALVHDPEFLVLDEPFSGLDPIGIQALSDVLRDKRDAGVPIIFSSHQLDLVERLISSVGMIKDGAMRLTSSVADVRSQAAPRLRIQLANAPAGWSAKLPGKALEENSGWALVDPQDAETNEILRSAASLGTVEHFGWDEPSLNEIFQEVVG